MGSEMCIRDRLYTCKEEGSMDLSNINAGEKDAIFNLSSIGIGRIFIMYDDYLKLINGENDSYNDGKPKLQIYRLSTTKNRFVSSVSWGVLKLKKVNYVSAAHCQEGQGGQVYSVNWVGDGLLSNVGGKVKVPKRKTKKQRKTRKTHKRNNKTKRM